jgi:hypothetical protein
MNYLLLIYIYHHFSICNISDKINFIVIRPPSTGNVAPLYNMTFSRRHFGNCPSPERMNLRKSACPIVSDIAVTIFS